MAAAPGPPPPRRLTLVASDVAPIGGMERVAYELTRRLLARGWAVTIIARSCALAPGPGLRFVALRSPGRPVSVALACDFVLGALALRRHRDGIVQTNNPTLPSSVDVIHVHFCEAAFRRRAGFSRSRRSSAAYRLNSWLATGFALLCERWSYRPGRVRRAVCVSHAVAAELGALYPAVGPVVTTIANGVDAAAFARRPADRARIRAALGVGEDQHLAVFVGGDWHRKGLRHAIEAVAAAPGWRLAVLGDGDPGAFADALAATHAGQVTFLGHVADPIPYYSAGDAFVLPSHYETFGLVGLEAAAAGLPVIMPRASGAEDYVRDGVNGWLVEPDGPQIAGCLATLADDPQLAARMGHAAAQTAQEFDWERITDAWEALYARLTPSPPRPARAASPRP